MTRKWFLTLDNFYTLPSRSERCEKITRKSFRDGATLAQSLTGAIVSKGDALDFQRKFLSIGRHVSTKLNTSATIAKIYDRVNAESADAPLFISSLNNRRMLFYPAIYYTIILRRINYN